MDARSPPRPRARLVISARRPRGRRPRLGHARDRGVAGGRCATLDDDELEASSCTNGRTCSAATTSPGSCRCIVRAVAGLHPAVWWIDRQLHIERETACDDWADQPHRIGEALRRVPARSSRRFVPGRTPCDVPGPVTRCAHVVRADIDRVHQARDAAARRIAARRPSVAVDGDSAGAAGARSILAVARAGYSARRHGVSRSRTARATSATTGSLPIVPMRFAPGGSNPASAMTLPCRSGARRSSTSNREPERVAARVSRYPSQRLRSQSLPGHLRGRRSLNCAEAAACGACARQSSGKSHARGRTWRHRHRRRTKAVRAIRAEGGQPLGRRCRTPASDVGRGSQKAAVATAGFFTQVEQVDRRCLLTGSHQCASTSSIPPTSRSAPRSSRRGGSTCLRRRRRAVRRRRRSSTRRSSRSILDSVAPGDVVGIGIHTANALRGYEIGRVARAAGAIVVFGGIHATLYPDEAREHGQRARGRQGRRRSDLGDGSRRLRGRSAASRSTTAAASRATPSLPARWDLLPADRYMWGSVQTVRGCPEALFVLLGLAHRRPEAATARRRRGRARGRGAAPTRLPIHPALRRQLLSGHAGRSRNGRARRSDRAQLENAAGAAPGALRADGAARAAAGRPRVLHADHDGSRRGPRVPERDAAREDSRRARRASSRSRRKD